MEYPYKKIGESLYPIIPLKIEHGVAYDVHALIDSGSTLSIFRLDVAQSLGINYKSGKPAMIASVQGRFLAYLHPISMHVGSKKLLCKIGFSDNFNAKLNILGRTDFFDKFLITFDEKNKKVALEAT